MDKIAVNVTANLDGEVPSDDVLLDMATKAGWSDDPGTGHAVLIPDERGNPGYEVVSPLPHAPPIGWTPTPPIDELIRQRVAQEFARHDDEEIDDVIDAEDFDIPDELPNLETIYEFMGVEREAPAVKPPTREQQAEAQVAYEELLERHRRVAKNRAREEYERIKKAARDQFGEPPDDPNFIKSASPSE